VRLLGLLAPQIASRSRTRGSTKELASRERRMEDDLRAARELQCVLMPARAPEIEGLEIATATARAGDHRRPVRFPPPERAPRRGGLRRRERQGSRRRTLRRPGERPAPHLAPDRSGPADLMRALNELLIQRRVEARYVTLSLMLGAPSSREFVLANAGAIPPMVCRGGEILRLRAEGVPLGLLDSREYEEVVFPAQSGDVILFYSTASPTTRIRTAPISAAPAWPTPCAANCALPAGEIVAAVFGELDRFSTALFDDQTLLAIKVK